MKKKAPFFESSAAWALFISISLIWLMGISLILFAFVNGFNTLQFVISSKTADGIVADYAENNFDPIIEFKTGDGRMFKFNGSSGSKTKSYETNDKITVRYNPKDPTQAMIDDYTIVWGDCVALLITGMIFAGIASIFVIPMIIELREKLAPHKPASS